MVGTVDIAELCGGVASLTLTTKLPSTNHRAGISAREMSSSKAVRKVTQDSVISFVKGQREVVELYRRMCKSLPHVLNVYDIDMTPKAARHHLADLFRHNSHIRDPRVVAILVHKGQLELDETLLQYKQRSHLIERLGGKLYSPFDPTAQFAKSRSRRLIDEAKEMGL